MNYFNELVSTIMNSESVEVSENEALALANQVDKSDYYGCDQNQIAQIANTILAEIAQNDEADYYEY
jgi:hypothetical protein